MTFSRALSGALIFAMLGCAARTPEVGLSRDDSPHQVRFVHVGAVSLEVLDWGGSGSDLILLHGATTSPHYFDDLAPPLTRTFRVVSFARRGHGGSTTPASPFTLDTLTGDLRQVMEALQIERASLLAHSFGGAEITRFAVQSPERVLALVYLDAHYERIDRPRTEPRIPWPSVSCYGPETTSLEEFRSCLRIYELPGVEWTGAWQAVTGDMIVETPDGGIALRVDQDIVMGSMREINREYRREYEQIDLPVLFLMAEDNLPRNTTDSAWNQKVQEWHEAEFVPGRAWIVDRLRQALPQARIQVIPGTSHLNIVAKNRNRLLREVTTFLAGADGREP